MIFGGFIKTKWKQRLAVKVNNEDTVAAKNR
jgi:hypothetical protein